MKSSKKMVIVVAFGLLIISAICFWKGFDYKNNYYQSEKYPSLNKNVYVGGDAYNYIINSNYFTGFMMLGSSAGIGAVILISTGLLLRSKDGKESPAMPEEHPAMDNNNNEQELD